MTGHNYNNPTPTDTAIADGKRIWQELYDGVVEAGLLEPATDFYARALGEPVQRGTNDD